MAKSHPTPDLDGELDELYALPLEEFTSARNALAKRLGDAGDKDAAATVKKLSKPNVAAWGLNQLSRSVPEDLGRLLEIRDELEHAGGPQEVRKLSDERRRLIGHLVNEASGALDRAGHSAAAATRDRISQSLLAGGDDEERDALLNGRLSKEITSSGLDAFGMEAFEAAVVTKPRPSATARREVDKLERDAEDAEQLASDLTRRAKQIEEEARAAMEEAADARRDAIKARDRAKRSARDL
ncbi:MAG: hypothetical protein ACRDKT_15350 [Actinomycetota bacterium]